ncbi:MAG: hypothetical protein IPJ19_03310 [Planctomycetes bacterium]|nr:hypothetical protein [Planctomycetota bacterium]
MNLTSITTLAGLALASAAAWTLGGSQGAGVLAGFCAGASVAGLCLLLQRKTAQHRPQFLVQAVLAGFLIKAFALLVGTLAVRYYAPLAQVCDAVTFLLAFAVSAIAILVPATLDTLRLLETRRTAEATR